MAVVQILRAVEGFPSPVAVQAAVAGEEREIPTLRRRRSRNFLNSDYPLLFIYTDYGKCVF